MHDYAALIAGVACAAAGGELFVRSAVGLARAMRVSAAVIGTTIAAFATSSPELAVAISSALEQRPQIAMGDALGSSIVNIALILGLSVALAPVQSSRGSLKRDFPVALAVSMILVPMSADGTLTRVEGALLLAFFVVWVWLVTRQARRERSEAAETPKPAPGGRAAALGVVGLALLFGAGRLIVVGATGIAESFGMSEFAIGATIVAVGTSVPELATAIVAKLRGHDEVGLGMLLGSNIFNSLWIVPVAALIYPIAVEWREVAAALVFGVLAMVFSFPPREGLLRRWRGFLLLLIYAAYLAVVLIS